MSFPNLFNSNQAEQMIQRIEQLSPSSPAKWGKMNVSQMLAHLSVMYEMTYNPNYPKPNPIMKLVLKFVVKGLVTSEKPYPKNGRTAPNFIIANERDFQNEKQRLIAFIRKTQQLGESEFEGKENISFGRLTSEEWNALFYKHLDHHLAQFGV